MRGAERATYPGEPPSSELDVMKAGWELALAWIEMER